MASLLLTIDTPKLATALVGAVILYAVSRAVYLAYFHPLSKFPGPPLAAVSNVWYGYHWLSGRYPWAVERALREYGPVVRIAPNELAFFRPQAFTDIYLPHEKHLERFVKTDFNDRGEDLGGIIWEEDPARHRAVARKLSPAFSGRALRAMEPAVHAHLDYFVERMRELSSRSSSSSSSSHIPLVRWTSWLAMDLSADLTWSEQKHEMRDMKNSVHLDTLLAFNVFATAIQVFRRFPLLRACQYLFVPPTQVRLHAAMVRATRASVERRLLLPQRGAPPRADRVVDFCHRVLPAAAGDADAVPERELLRLGSVAFQLLFAGWGPMADLFYGVLALLTAGEGEDECYRRLVAEVRGGFEAYGDITSASVAPLPFLHACLEETLRVLPSNLTGLPRISPGAVVDGRFVPKGAQVQTCLWALARHPDYFHEPLRFRPQRWLSADHPLYDKAFANDHVKSLYPFSLGPRVCLGREMAWMQAKLFVAKVLWTFDIVRVPGQNFDLETQLRHYGFFEKPELYVQFAMVSR
ncbi:cytochrome P450 [Xylariomycetidae sp. FL0641]|nr:cytochrome P450 [Xylariomycetidae sp. FL0641]